MRQTVSSDTYYPQYNTCDEFDVISINNFKTKFTNRYCHSMFNAVNLKFNNQESYRKPLYSVARLLARFVVKPSFEDLPELAQLDIQPDTINQVITCMTSNCTEWKLKRNSCLVWRRHRRMYDWVTMQGHLYSRLSCRKRLRHERPSWRWFEVCLDFSTGSTSTLSQVQTTPSLRRRAKT